ncbi:hypothetical protein [Pseudoclavibacter helvolus]|uniref:hypothetical protein n=1 Tax=Pseudoclavibacter helvolus TaxID=255205 RepID=UPI003736A7E0
MTGQIELIQGIIESDVGVTSLITILIILSGGVVRGVLILSRAFTVVILAYGRGLSEKGYLKLVESVFGRKLGKREESSTPSDT